MKYFSFLLVGVAFAAAIAQNVPSKEQLVENC